MAVFQSEWITGSRLHAKVLGCSFSRSLSIARSVGLVGQHARVERGLAGDCSSMPSPCGQQMRDILITGRVDQPVATFSVRREM